jgi:hypothetical protein
MKLDSIYKLEPWQGRHVTERDHDLPSLALPWKQHISDLTEDELRDFVIGDSDGTKAAE